MARWDALAKAAPELAADGRRLLTRSVIGEGLLATVRGDAPPRVHPVYVEIVDGRLLTFVQSGSAKASDLAMDGRYALHAHVDAAAPDEFTVRGRASEVANPDLISRARAAWAFDATAGYRLFELDIETALLGRRPTADDWPPVYASWRADGDRSPEGQAGDPVGDPAGPVQAP